MQNSTVPSRPLAVVTGASSGIGRELAKQFASNGYDLLIAAEDDGINAAATELQRLGANVSAVQADLATPEGVETLANRIDEAAPVEAIAINAGVGVGGEFISTPLEDELRLIDLNVRSTVHLAKRVVPQMVSRKRGKILFTSSIASLMATPYETVYGPSKAFVKSFAAALRHEIAEDGVTVTTLMPGPTETNFFHRAGMDDTKIGEAEKADAADVARQGYDALMAGKEEIIAGPLKTKIEGLAAKVLPESVTAAQHGGQAKPGSASH